MNEVGATRAIGVDVGGTFTDLASVDQHGNVDTVKVLSVPADRAAGVLNLEVPDHCRGPEVCGPATVPVPGTVGSMHQYAALLRGIAPSYEQKHFDAASKRGQLRLVAARDGAGGAVTIHADARLYAGLFDGHEAAELGLAAGRIAYVHLVRGALKVNGQDLTAGDALQVRETSRLAFTAGQEAEVLVFDLAA